MVPPMEIVVAVIEGIMQLLSAMISVLLVFQLFLREDKIITRFIIFRIITQRLLIRLYTLRKLF